MQRTLTLILTLALATTTLLPSTSAHPEDAGKDIKLYLNKNADGALALTSLPPSSRNATTWTTSGMYQTQRGLEIEIRITDPNPNWVIDESKGAAGWITYGFKQSRTNTLVPSLYGNPYGVFQWTLVEGARASQMMLECAKRNATYSSRCDAQQYRADFPGHAKGGVPHTHGDGTDAARGLHSGDLEWVLSYRIPPCTTISPYYCSLAGSTQRYEFSVLLDGTTFLHYVALDEEHPAAAEPTEGAANETVDDNASATNATEAPENEDGNGTGNETGNETGSESQGSAFKPEAYKPQGASGASPGAGLAAVLATLAVGLLLRRRSR